MKVETPCRFARSVRRTMVVIFCLAFLIVSAAVTRASVALGGETLRIEQTGRVSNIRSDAPMIIEIAPGIGEVIFDGVSAPGLKITGGSADTIVKFGGDLVIGGPLVIDVDGRIEVDTRSGGRGLRLTARDSLRLEAPTVRLADSKFAPLELRSGGELVVVARDLLDVDALDDPATRIVSSGDLVLRSDSPVHGDAHWRAGRDLRVERLDGRAGDLVSPKDPVVLTTRNVSLGTYSGASLHILAGGSVTAGNVTINGSDTAANTIGPGNTAAFNGTDTFADLANVVLSDGTPVAVDGAARPTLDIRAGIDWSTFTGGPPVPDDRVVGAVSPTFGSPVTSADISLGFVRVHPSAGLVLLTNRYHPDAALLGLISTNSINTVTGVPAADGGSVFVDSKGDALLGSIDTEAFVLVKGVTPVGSAGDVTVLAAGDLDVSMVTASSRGTASLGAGNGGKVTLVAGGRLLSAPDISTFASSSLGSGDGGDVHVDVRGPATLGRVLTGSEVTVTGNSGNAGSVMVFVRSDGPADGGEFLLITDVLADAGSVFYAGVVGASGNGGRVELRTEDGSIEILERIWTYTDAGGGTNSSGNGGDVVLEAVNGDVIIGTLWGDLGINTRTVAGEGGTGTTGRGGNVDLTASGSITITPSVTNGGIITSTSSELAEAGQCGFVSAHAVAGNIDLGISGIQTDADGRAGITGPGGAVDLTAAGTITTAFIDSSSIGRDGGSAAAGGAVTVSGGGAVATGTVDARARVEGPGGNVGNGGDVVIESATGSVGTGLIITASYAMPGTGDAANGGSITVTAADDVLVAPGQSYQSYGVSADGAAGAGGDIIVTAGDSAQLGNLVAYSSSTNGAAGDGGQVSITLGGALSGNPSIWTYAFGSTAAGRAGHVVLDVSGPTNLGSIGVHSRVTGIGDASGSGDISVVVRDAGPQNGADDLVIGSVFTDSGTWFYGSAIGSAGDSGTVNLETEDGDVIITGQVYTFCGVRGPTSSCGKGGDLFVRATGGEISIGDGGVNATSIVGGGSTGTAGQGGTIRLIADGDVVLPSTTNGTGLWVTCTADDGVATGAGEIEVRSLGGAVDLGTKFFAARSHSERGTAGPGGTVIVNAATTITGGEIDVSSYSNTGTGSPAGYVDVRAIGDVELSRIRGTSEGVGGMAEGGLFVIDTLGLLRLTGGAVDQPTVDATGLAATGWVVLSHGGGAAIPFTVGDATTNGSAWNVVAASASLAPTTPYAQTHHEAPSIWILGDEPALLVNEIDVDQPGTDGGEFIEIHNPLPADQVLDLTYFDIVDGTGGWANVIHEPAIRGLSIPAGGHLVLCPTGSTLESCDYYDDFTLPDVGPAAVSIRMTGIIEDVVSYEGDTPEGFTEGTGVGLEDPGTSDHRSLSRIPDGADTNHNANDFSLRCVSPGLPNLDATASCTSSGGPELGAISATPGVIDEGSSVLVAGSFFEPPPAAAHTVSIDWGDGTTTDIPLGAGTTVYDASHLFADDAFGLDTPLDIRVSVTDGVSMDEGWASITILNVDPSVDAGPDQIVMLGETVAFSGGFSDPGSLDTHTLLWTFGDGSSDDTSLNPTHTYAGAGTYTVTLQVEDDDGGLGGDSLFVEVEAAAPRVVRLDTVARAGAGGLSDGEGLTQPVTAFEVSFSHEMMNPAGSASPIDVTNPENYRVIVAGGDGVINTFTCDPPSGDDEIVGLADVVWDGPTRTAAVRIASEASLERGSSRLIFCADGLTSTEGAGLDGNGDGTGGDDLLLDFSVLRTNLFGNPNFDLSLSGWTDVSPAGSNFAHTAVDGEGSTWSGSSQATNAAGAGAHLELNRCVELPPESVDGITLRALVRMDPVAVDDSRASAELRFFAGPGCTGALLETRPASPALADTAGSFIPVASPGRPPGDAVSVEAALLVDADAGAPSAFTVAFDRVSLAADGAIFEDGFEMGDSAEWDSTTP